MYGVMNTLSAYTYFYISKNITLYNPLLVFNVVKAFSVLLNSISRFISNLGILIEILALNYCFLNFTTKSLLEQNISQKLQVEM